MKEGKRVRPSPSQETKVGIPTPREAPEEPLETPKIRDVPVHDVDFNFSDLDDDIVRVNGIEVDFREVELWEM